MNSSEVLARAYPGFQLGGGSSYLFRDDGGGSCPPLLLPGYALECW
ncbi:unnamed protein product [Plutella xylostella]|uniref:(diamondback moth) hypothetical protein n=1 Tax=Plutella xylostella TaxID=51655 RepID=A0A8S4F6N2_PLUXY|nr:unnamed protein product [Plutella xylostella]